MVVLNKKEQVMLFRPRGRFGFTKADRLKLRSYNEALLTNPYAGIYQGRRTKKGTIFVREKFYSPFNPRTIKQQAWRAVFFSAVQAYRELSPEALKYWNVYAKTFKMTGYNKFISEYLKTHKI
jgi:hypothetical protein